MWRFLMRGDGAPGRRSHALVQEYEIKWQITTSAPQQQTTKMSEIATFWCGDVAMRRCGGAVMGHERADAIDMKRYWQQFNAARRRILASVAGIELPRSEPPQPFNKAAHGDLETTGLSRSAD
jgi:hypothetical protein